MIVIMKAKTADYRLRREIKDEVWRKLGGYPTRKQEIELCRQMHEGDTKARELLILSGAGMAAAASLKFLNSGPWNTNDLISMGVEALVSRIDKFDWKRGRLTTFVWHVVLRAMVGRCMEERSVIRVPRNSPFLAKKSAAWNVGPLDSIGESGAEDVCNSLSDEDRMRIKDAVGSLSWRQREIIRLRYYEGKTLREVGSVIGVTRERVRQIEAKTLGTLKNLLSPP